jgi:hypothetical protein
MKEKMALSGATLLGPTGHAGGAKATVGGRTKQVFLQVADFKAKPYLGLENST